MPTYMNFLCRSRSNCTIFWEENRRLHLCHLLAQKSSRLPPLPCQGNQETFENRGRIPHRVNLYFDKRECNLFIDENLQAYEFIYFEIKRYNIAQVFDT